MKKFLALLLSLVLVAGCSSGSTTTTTTGGEATGNTTTTTEGAAENDYNFVYTADLSTFDYLYNNKSVNGEQLTNWIDGLVEQDPHGKLVPSIAESWTSNEDATEWTFTIRKGAMWVTNNQEEYAEVTANDFVAGLQHAADFDSETMWLVGDLIENLDAYASGEVTWDQVGIKAVDDYTLVYTLTSPAPYFDSMCTYTILYPVNQEFLESQGEGCKLGAPNPETCKFGSMDPTAILYNGAFVLTNYTPKSVLEYVRNEHYWDVANVHIPTVKLVFNDMSDVNSLFNAFDNGELSEAPIYQSNPAVYQQAVEKYGEDIYVTDTNATTYYATLNFNRQAYAAYTDPSKAVSPKTEEQRADTKTAILNKNFRLGVFAAFSSQAYGAQSNGDDLSLAAARNCFTAPNFVSLSDGTTYQTLMEQAMAKADSTNFGGIDLSDGQDAYYNPEKAVAFMEAAKEELGDTVTWPIYLDVVVNESNDMNVRTSQAIKKSIEDAIGEYVQVNLVTTDQDSFYNSFYYISTGADANFDLCFTGGWGPDYADPRSYNNIFLPDNGDMLNMSGLSIAELNIEGDAEIKEQIGLIQFGEEMAAADAITDDNDARFTAFAEAEATLIANGIIRPFITQGARFRVSKVVPYTQAYGLYGAAAGNTKWKYMQVSDTIITTEEHGAAKEAWLASVE